MSKLSSKNQVTIPVDVLRKAGIGPGDEVSVKAVGPGRIEIQRDSDRAAELIARYAGSLTYPKDYLSELRNEWDQ